MLSMLITDTAKLRRLRKAFLTNLFFVVVLLCFFVSRCKFLKSHANPLQD